MNLLNRFLNKVDFNSYEEMKAESQLIVPKDFNFAYDIVDEYARLVPEKRALVWCNSEGDEKIRLEAKVHPNVRLLSMQEWIK